MFYKNYSTEVLLEDVHYKKEELKFAQQELKRLKHQYGIVAKSLDHIQRDFDVWEASRQGEIANAYYYSYRGRQEKLYDEIINIENDIGNIQRQLDHMQVELYFRKPVGKYNTYD